MATVDGSRFQLFLINRARETVYPGPSFPTSAEAFETCSRLNKGRRFDEDSDRYVVIDQKTGDLLGSG